MTSRTRWRPVRAAVAVAATLTLAVAACGVHPGPDAAFAPGGVRDTADQAGSGGSSSGTSLPAGYKLVHRKGIGVVFAVPKSWSVLDVDAGKLSASQQALAEDNPELAGILQQSSGLYADAKIVSAIGPADGSGTQSAIASQLGLSLRSIPAAMGQEVSSQFGAIGGSKVHTKSVQVRGLDADQESLRIDVTLLTGGRAVELHEMLVPAPNGIAIIAVRAAPAIADRILASVAVQ